jgi:diadenosine tetraphosphatase ApaH/serine/threonine PP2A family protein phosphatase
VFSTGFSWKREATGLRIRLLSDVHGNLPALERVLAHRQGLPFDETVCLGDVVGYGPWPSECVALVRDACGLTVAGNHDRGCAGLLAPSGFNSWGRAALLWSMDRLAPEDVLWLAGLPLKAVVNGLGFCHAHPLSPGSWRYITGPESADEVLRETRGAPWFYGHTHIPVAWGAGGTFRSPGLPSKLGEFPLVNCGSVGQPRDGDPRAAYTVVDTVAGTAETVRVEYPVETSARGIRNAGLPGFLAERLFSGI